MEILFLITARGGSKGIPGKNIKPLNSKPLIFYSIDVARKFVPDDMICVSTDNQQIIDTVNNYGLKVPFIRPDELSGDTVGSYEVILHALDFYEKKKKIDAVVLLQPTSPFRLMKHVKESIDLFNKDIDAVMSVIQTRSNPFQLLYMKNDSGLMEKVFTKTDYSRRQDLPVVYELNGAVYVLNTASLRKAKLSEFTKVVPYEMPEINSVDIDTPFDWAWAEFLLNEKLIKFDYGS